MLKSTGLAVLGGLLVPRSGGTHAAGAEGEPLRDLPELRSSGGVLDYRLDMAARPIRVGDRVIHVDTYNATSLLDAVIGGSLPHVIQRKGLVRAVHGVSMLTVLPPPNARSWFEGVDDEEGGRMLRAVYNGVVVAEAPGTIRVEGNDYFPPESLNREYFEDSPSKTVCPWKGGASYYNLHVGDEIVPDVAWTYKRPSPLARRIKNHVAFYGQVVVEGDPEGPRGGLFARLRGERA